LRSDPPPCSAAGHGHGDRRRVSRICRGAHRPMVGRLAATRDGCHGPGSRPPASMTADCRHHPPPPRDGERSCAGAHRRSWPSPAAGSIAGARGGPRACCASRRRRKPRRRRRCVRSSRRRRHGHTVTASFCSPKASARSRPQVEDALAVAPDLQGPLAPLGERRKTCRSTRAAGTAVRIRPRKMRSGPAARRLRLLIPRSPSWSRRLRLEPGRQSTGGGHVGLAAPDRFGGLLWRPRLREGQYSDSAQHADEHSVVDRP